MTDSISIYEQYNIDLNRLSRDYLKFPLKKGTGNTNKGEYPTKGDLEYLYLELNLTRKEIGYYFNRSASTVDIWLQYYKLPTKDKNKAHESHSKIIFKKYGVKNISQLDAVKTKKSNTFIQHYGCSNIFKDKKFIKEKIFEKYNGWYTQTTEYKDRIKPKKNEIYNKVYQTKKKNNTFKISKPETRIYEKLISRFPDTIRQYHSKDYPFACDFYIPILDLYIEYQGVFGHFLDYRYKEPFDSKNKIHRKLVKKIYKKSFEIITYGKHKGERKLRYICAIKQYCNNDPLKRKTAKENNLNWIEFFTEEDFNKWIETI